MAAMKKMQSMAEAMGKIMPGKMRDMRNYSLICKYFYVADYNNILNMLYLILREYGGGKSCPSPPNRGRYLRLWSAGQRI